MMTFNKLFSRTFFLVLVAFVMTSCQNSLVEEGVTAHGAQMDQTVDENGIDCEMVSQEVGFDLDMETRQPNPPSFSIAGTLGGYTSLHNVPSYQLGQNCLCEIQKFELDFSNLPNSSALNLYNDSGDPIQFDPPVSIGNNISRITIGAEHLNMGLYISYNQADPSPSLVNAGGLCMVDNVSGPEGSTRSWTTPYEHETVDDEGQPITLYYIPASTGSVTHRLVR